MPPDSGAGLFLRYYLLYGKPWQRAGIVLTLIAIGATLLAFGNLAGIAPTLLGLVLGIRMWGPARLRANSSGQPAEQARRPNERLNHHMNR